MVSGEVRIRLVAIDAVIEQISGGVIIATYVSTGMKSLLL